MKVGKLSATKISTFRSCHLRYWFQYISKLKPKNVGGYEVGSLTHKALEIWHNDKNTDLESLIEAVWRAATKSNEEDQKVIRQTIEILTEWYPKYDTDEEIIGVEQKFDLELSPGVFVRGSIDKIVKYDEHTVAIVDYKTSWRAATREEMDNNIQLGIYNLAARQLYPWATNFVLILDFIRHGPQETQYTESELEFLCGWLSHIHNTIKLIEDPKAAPSADSCRWCGFHGDCPAYQSLLSEEVLPLAPLPDDADAIVDEYDKLTIQRKAVEERMDVLKEWFKELVSSNDGKKIDTPGWAVGAYQRKMKTYNPVDVLEILGPGVLAMISKVSVIELNKYLKEYPVTPEQMIRLSASVRIDLAEPSVRVNLKKKKE